MDIRSQTSMVFHLDKCIGCHTCSMACKNMWTDRKGAEYMWWNNVETKPGTGYPHRWEDQSDYHGGWELKNGKLNLKGAGKWKGLADIFHNPKLPDIDDYYEPWRYSFEDLYKAEEDTQPVARPISHITGKQIEVKSGPNWDDDLGGSELYAKNDVNLEKVSAADKAAMDDLERMVMMYLPRICNHCQNPSCVASCPSGAIYKRGEDGIVLINQEKCRGWRMCVTACPYKKTYYNWNSGKSEKCILCYPGLECGETPSCMHSCVGRIRYLGVLFYDADKIKDIAHTDKDTLIDAQLESILDPFDPDVIKQARDNGIHDSTIEAAQKSPIYKWVKQWKVALPLHAEYRTVPMLFYVPPLLPVMGKLNDNTYGNEQKGFFTTIDQSRLPVEYLANLFSCGDGDKIKQILKKLMAVRLLKRHETVGDLEDGKVKAALSELNMTEEEAEEIFRLSTLATFGERFVIPPAHREEAIGMDKNVLVHKGDSGFGFTEKPERIS
jgi:nitrate reductase / nitrite oxidoreductase, beta subunit